MDRSILPGDWMWHPDWSEESGQSAGAFVHFRSLIKLETPPAGQVRIRITADTKYKLFVNSNLVCSGPVKGDSDLWFYDEVNIGPYLTQGINHIAIKVLRLFHATSFATSFPRLEFPGLFVGFSTELEATGISKSWETALDSSTCLPTNLDEDDFLHIYEQVSNTKVAQLQWCPVRRLEFPTSHGLSSPWKLSRRMIPQPKAEPAHFESLSSVRSPLSPSDWERVLLHTSGPHSTSSIRLPAGTSHHLELKASTHLTAFLRFCFERPRESGSILRITYSECYEDTPTQIPYLRSKGDRCDTQKQLLGPQDVYLFGGDSFRAHAADLKYDSRVEDREVFAPFHYRTFRFLTLDIYVDDRSDLVLQSIEMTTTNYPLDVRADVNVQNESTSVEIGSSYRQIWDTSIRTLVNCMHDCYEDCPFYEQLQYAMDTRSSILFTYSISGDDRLARQAIIQLHNSYRPDTGLTASRAPSHQRQLIPHFSLFWIMMVADHFQHFADVSFVRRFTPACDGVLEHFARRVDSDTGLVRALPSVSDCWDFVDWADQWRPMGIPPAADRTGHCTYTSMVYSYSLKLLADMLDGMQRPGLAGEYRERADSLVQALRRHCFDGQFFTDGLAIAAVPDQDYSQHSQVWAVLCGATVGQEAEHLLSQALAIGNVREVSNASTVKFTQASIAMSFYTLRARSMVGGTLYDNHFHAFWKPWKAQLDLNLLTWEEDSVSQRSDCHAWGCAALYEFTREVAGIRSGKSGWEVLDFRPRLALFSSADIKVPFGLLNRSRDTLNSRFEYGSGVANVRWQTEESGDITCSLALQMTGMGEGTVSVLPAVRILLPGSSEEIVQDASSVIVRVIKAETLSKLRSHQG